jgi:hypothetical protein
MLLVMRGLDPRIHADVSVIDVFARVRKFNRSMDCRAFARRRSNQVGAASNGYDPQAGQARQ